MGLAYNVMGVLAYGIISIVEISKCVLRVVSRILAIILKYVYAFIAALVYTAVTESLFLIGKLWRERNELETLNMVTVFYSVFQTIYIMSKVSYRFSCIEVAIGAILFICIALTAINLTFTKIIYRYSTKRNYE